MPKTNSNSNHTTVSQSFYHCPEWDNAEFRTEFNGDAIQKLVWCGLRARCTGELSNFLDYLMWTLDAQRGGKHTYTTRVQDWHFKDGKFDAFFCYKVVVKRNGREIPYFDATADIADRMIWTFGFFDGEDIDTTPEFDFSCPSDLSRAAVELGVGIYKFMWSRLDDHTSLES